MCKGFIKTAEFAHSEYLRASAASDAENEKDYEKVLNDLYADIRKNAKPKLEVGEGVTK